MVEGPEHRFSFINDSYRQTLGERPLIGNTIVNIFPELKDQIFVPLLDRVFASGQAHTASEPIRIRVDPQGPVEDRRVTFTYAPVRAGDGAASGIYIEGQLEPLSRVDTLEQRALTNGLSSLSDEELLTLFIDQRKDDGAAPEIARDLLDRFDGLGGVLAASLPSLAQVGPTANRENTVRALNTRLALHLKLAREIGGRILRQRLARRPGLKSMAAVQAYVRALLAHERREQFRVLFLDSALNLIADEMMWEGSVSGCAVHVREIMRRALELGSKALILVHNHPARTEKISAADRAITKDIVVAGRALDIDVLDHLVVAGDRVVTFRQRGLL